MSQRIGVSGHSHEDAIDPRHSADSDACRGLALFDHEDPYGRRKRLNFAVDVLNDCQPGNVLDIGCGLGTNLTIPLATQFPNSRFLASDLDRLSIQTAQRANRLPNLRFVTDADVPRGEKFDLIIASEVLEHVDDPREFLTTLRRQVSENGCLLLTIPNGFGPFECAALSYTLLSVSGMYATVRRLLGRTAPASDTNATSTHDTLAVSPHCNFFSSRGFRRVAQSAGWRVSRFRPRTFICGWLLDKIVSRQKMARWNARISDFLPAWACSGWMFVLHPVSGTPNGAPYQRSWSARWRSRLNAKCYGVDAAA